ncbi:MAG: hypothetical protein KF858_10050 [Candidatus Sumerlaeia bacterium]|nr:hypothetical protein [Candidatus Sumerlaeia bacterium]
MESALEQYYFNIGFIHRWSALFAKLALVSILAAVVAGNRKPGQQFLALAFAVQFLLAGWLAVTINTSEEFAGYAARAALPVGILSIVLALAMGLTLFYPEGQWRVRHEQGWRTGLGWALIVLGFVYPFHGDGSWRGALWSPVGAIPHPGLLIAGALAWIGMPDTHRLAAWTLALGALAIGAIDIAAGEVRSSWLLVGVGGLLLVDLVRSTLRSGGVVEDDTPRVDRQKRERVQREVQEKTKPQGRTWKLK